MPIDDTVKNRISTSRSVTRSTGPGVDPSLLEKPTDEIPRTILGQIGQLRRGTADPVDLQHIDALEQQAKDLYDGQANKAEWLGVAERVGNAMVKLGAAGQAAKAGVDVSRVQDLAPTDWEGQIGRYGKEYQTELGRVDKKRGDLREVVRENQKALDRDYEDKAKGLGQEYDFAKYQYGQDMDTYQAAQRDKAAHQREMERIGFQESSMNAREDRRDKAASTASDRQLLALQAADLQKQIAESQLREKSASEVANALAMQDDLSSRSVSKIETQLPGAMGKAGISPETLDSIQKRVELKETGDPTEPGLLWGTNRDEGAKKRALLQKELVAPQVAHTGELRAALQKVLSGGGASRAPAASTSGVGTSPGTSQVGKQLVQEMSPAAPATAPAAAPDSKVVTPAELQAYMQQHRVSEQVARDTLGKAGFVVSTGEGR